MGACFFRIGERVVMTQERVFQNRRVTVHGTKRFFDMRRKHDPRPQGAETSRELSDVLEYRVRILKIEIEKLEIVRLRESARERQIGFDF